VKTTITLVHKNCDRGCRICAYGGMRAVDYGEVRRTIETLMRQNYRVHLYDFFVKKESLALFRLTRQFEGKNPGWLNVTAEFAPDAGDVAYLNSLRTAVAISLHGSTAEVHKRSSGQDDYVAIVQFLESFHRRFELRLGLNYVVSHANIGDLEAMLSFAERFKLDFLELIPLGFSGNAVHALGRDAVLTAADKRVVHALVTQRRAMLPYRLELDAIWGPDFVNDPAPQCRFFAAAVPGTYCNAGINHWAIRLNDRKVFPCPCMASIDALAVGEFDGEKLQLEPNWLDHKTKIEAPCAGCSKFSECQGGCRLTAMSEHRVAHGSDNRYAGFSGCLYHLAGPNGVGPGDIL